MPNDKNVKSSFRGKNEPKHLLFEIICLNTGVLKYLSQKNATCIKDLGIKGIDALKKH